MDSSLEKNKNNGVDDEGVTDLKKILSGKSNDIEPDKKSTYRLSDRMKLMMNFVDEERNNLQNQPWSKLDKSKNLKAFLIGSVSWFLFQ